MLLSTIVVLCSGINRMGCFLIPFVYVHEHVSLIQPLSTSTTLFWPMLPSTIVVLCSGINRIGCFLIPCLC
ncbi:hypothetical protein B0H34DRAFT_733526 [Crassisporium funariophilum]|nr:hypothetical protein B0H34DRAFT_733526 [Crassisporium funariophilum]